MIDKEVVIFYNNIKSPDWPTIQSYHDFKNLPIWIQDECKVLHGFDHKRQQLRDPNHWAKIYTTVYVKNNLAYVPVPKCAQSYYMYVLTNLGWVANNHSQLNNDVKLFGLIMHPLQRKIKAITQFIIDCFTTNLDKASELDNRMFRSASVDWDKIEELTKSSELSRLIANICVGDWHSIPYHIMFGDDLHKINWIPMDGLSDTEIKQCVMDFFVIHGLQETLPLNDQRIHISCDRQKKLNQWVEQILLNNHDHQSMFQQTYCKDLAFYYDLLDTFDKNWQHIK